MENRQQKKKFAAGILLLVLAFFFQLAARYVHGFGEWYGSTIYPLLVCVIGGLSNLVPFSVVEILLYLFLILGLWYGITHRKKPFHLISSLVFFLGFLAFSYTLNCGINYYRLPFSHFLNLEIRPSSEDELKELCIFLAEKVKEAAIDKEAENKEESGTAPGAGEGRQANKAIKRSIFSRQAREDMKKLGQSYPQLSGFYPRPKPLFVSEILSYQSLSGIYSPFTIEANYNGDMTDYNISHTACHELSHLRGFMREDEANFIGYLACVGSDAAFSRYSGYLSGFIYAVNALYRQNPDAAAEVYLFLPDCALTDLHTNNQFWKQYEGPVAEVSTRVNDTYLKANSQSDGVKSYGRMVDLLLAYYRRCEKEHEP